ncbi:MAG: ABC-F family ATP-binding cassette domain-containing protein [Candidatus Riflebacteria bacterium]|nr:ABC-F family ATP-binding cassette domain-containing protein [Candidatus Riflebacteria bacterium]
MLIIAVSNLSYTFPGAVQPVFTNLNFSVDSDARIGLVGPNGCGKTTLLQILAGKISGFCGQLTGKPVLRIATLSQETGERVSQSVFAFIRPQIANLRKEIDRLEKSCDSDAAAMKLAGFYNDFSACDGFNVEADIARLFSEFSLPQEFLWRPLESLSGGEKNRVGLVRLLLDKPDLLLLDEPTNHLDVEALEWLENYLRNLKIPWLVVSHDRRFLDNCCETVWELKNGSLSEYGGNYSFYRLAKDQAHARKVLAAEIADRHIERLQKAAEKQRNDANRMESFKPKRDRTKKGGICKRDEGSAKALLRTQNKQRAATAMEQRLQRLVDKAQAEKPFIEKTRSISFPEKNLKNSCVLRVEGLSKSYGSLSLFADFSLTLLNGDRLAIVGPNGSGKSTLMRMLAGCESSDGGLISWAPAAVVAYHAQEFEQLDFSATVLDHVLAGDYAGQTRARTILGCLKLEKDKVDQQIATLSVGERSKTALARLLFMAPDVLLLDEPTNHLEIDAREALEEALADFVGTVVFVSHDRHFVEKISTRQIVLPGV